MSVTSTKTVCSNKLKSPKKHGSHSFDELEIVKKIGGSDNNKVFQVKCKRQSAQFALKLFPCTENTISSEYQNESRFANLSHENIIKFHSLKPFDNLFSLRDEKHSSIIMELARCDFKTAIQHLDLKHHEKLVRTYFHQLIQGIKYLHSKGASHMDLKPENLLLGMDHNLKITDFDLSFQDKDSSPKGLGSFNFRAPEVKENRVTNPKSADIFSAGIILFFLKYGFLPYSEDTNGTSIQFDFLMKDPKKFWRFHDIIQTRDNKDFIELFEGMTKYNEEDRMALSDVEDNKWFKSEIYTKKELDEIVSKIFQ